MSTIYYIIQKIENKDESGLNYLYKNYSSSLFGIILRIVKDNDVSEEVLQKTFVKIWNNINQYEEKKGTLFTWMSTIARNTAIDKIRLKSFQNTQKSESYDSTVHNYATTNINQNNIDVDALMLKLEDKYKIILNKIYLEGYSQSDLAKELNLPLGTIKSRIRIALRILREELDSEKGLFLGSILFFTILMYLIKVL